MNEISNNMKTAFKISILPKTEGMDGKTHHCTQRNITLLELKIFLEKHSFQLSFH